MSEPTPLRVGSLPGDLDDDVTAPVRPDEKSTVGDTLLADLEKALSADVVQEPVTLEVLKRPGVSIRYSTDFDDEKLTAWRKRATDRRRGGEDFNSLKFCLIVLANTCESIRFNGRDVHDEEGTLLTFRHRKIRDMLKLGEHVPIVEVARALIGNDPHCMLHANEVMDAAGFGDSAVTLDDDDAGDGGPTFAG